MSAAKRVKFEWADESDTSDDNSEAEDTETEVNVRGRAEALGNPLVLHKIIEALDYHELMACRLVNSIWSKIASEVIRRKDCTMVTMRYDSGGNVYRRFPQHGRHGPEFTGTSLKLEIVRGQCLPSFNKILENSKDFPCTDFSFDGGRLDNEEVKLFFRLNGDKIKTLELEGNAEEDAKNPVELRKVLQEILQERAVNVENLRIENFDYEWTNQDELFLPALKSFQWLRSSETVLKILSSSPNLQTVRDIHIGGDVDVLIRSGKISTVKEIRCGGYDSSSSVYQFVDARPQLRKLRFLLHSDISALTSSYEKLFEVNKDTLELLELSEGCSLAGIKIPKLKNLKTLELGVNFGQRIFPCRINLNDTFPQLTKLDFSHVRMHVGWNKYFPPPDAYRGDLPNVNTLKAADGLTELWMQNLRVLCPNFTRLIIYSESNTPTTLPLVFRLWKFLQSLELEITYVQNGARGDSDFTGMSSEDCWRLQGTTKSGERVEGYEQLRVRPSICDLKDLRTLRIAFHSGFNGQLIPITSISGLYGFSLLPNLKVILEFDHSFHPSGLESIYKDLSPYMNIRHRQAICVLPVEDLLLRL